MISINKIFSKFKNESGDVLRTLSKSQKNITPLWLASLAINIFALGLPLTMLQAYDRILPYHGIGTLQSLSLLMIGIFIFEFILKYLRSYLTAWAGSVFEHNSTMESIDQIITCDLSDYELYGSKEIQSKFNEISKLRSFFGGQALTTVVDFPFSFIFLFVIYMISGRLVIVPAIFFLCVIAIAVYLGRHIRIEMKKKSVNDAKLYKLILESFESIESVKAGGYENHFKKRFQYFSEKSIESNYQTLFFNGVAFNLGFIFNQLMTMGILGAGAYLIIKGELGVGGLAACTILAGRIMQPVQKILGLWTRFQGLNISFKNLQDIKSLKRSVVETDVQYPVLGKVEFKNVSINYNDKVMVNDFSAIFVPGDIVYVTGHNSFVTSQLCDAILGIRNVDVGEVLVDSVNPFTAVNTFHKNHIAYLSANNSLFKGSVFDNLSSFGSVDKERTIKSNDVLGLNHYISALPEGHLTKLENLGSDPVSPGVKQKMLISRSLSTDAKVYIFDNADVGLDRAGYNDLFKAVGQFSDDVTTFIFSEDANFSYLANISVAISEDGKWELKRLKEKFQELSFFPEEMTEYYERCF